MQTPESTSAEGLAGFVGGKALAFGRGDAWRDMKAWVVNLPLNADAMPIPSVSEPFVAVVLSGEVDFLEREPKGPWTTNRLKRGSMFLTTGGAPYEVSWREAGPERFETMSVFIELPVLEQALEEVFGDNASNARLRDMSAFNDPVLFGWMQRVRTELDRERASPMLVTSLAQGIAIHLARNYTDVVEDPQSGSPSLPPFKLKQVTDWMAGNPGEEFNLDRLAAMVGLSKYYFNRLFKSAVGVPPSRYHLQVRMEEAQRLLRETRKSVVQIALELGYGSPSHFAQVFRRETGMSPSKYRKQR